jgi:hypothetical protein
LPAENLGTFLGTFTLDSRISRRPPPQLPPLDKPGDLQTRCEDLLLEQRGLQARYRKLEERYRELELRHYNLVQSHIPYTYFAGLCRETIRAGLRHVRRALPWSGA